MTIYILIGVIVLLAIFLISLVVKYNKFVRLRAAVNEAFATMDVYLKRRYDLIPNLVAVVKQYGVYEQQTLAQVMEARNYAMSSVGGGTANRVAGENNLSRALRSLVAVAENYPALKADGQYINLQNELSRLENDIAMARKYYNAVLKNYNNGIQVFPSNLYAAIFGFKPYPYFEISVEERQNVRVQF
ncbi:MAG TPA: LemA family protein [Clostridiaceae bacterium]|nr:LemA family protein [Clostridiaceae bacterium]